MLKLVRFVLCGLTTSPLKLCVLNKGREIRLFKTIDNICELLLKKTPIV